MDTNKDSNKRIALLESHTDMLETELSYLNGLLMDCGFPEGIKTLKETALELISENGGAFEATPKAQE